MNGIQLAAAIASAAELLKKDSGNKKNPAKLLTKCDYLYIIQVFCFFLMAQIGTVYLCRFWTRFE